ncbi:hypothetical protein B296_00046129 [Ensete ventricosum]|uniref:Uncharacterized protein n=1 Tax=Ensete ventricosum TaxID=4639 RepID=A0A426YTK6_ENSVE|nr:hypothetical protein B296_00046129 [Ensete ventricosum]
MVLVLVAAKSMALRGERNMGFDEEGNQGATPQATSEGVLRALRPFSLAAVAKRRGQLAEGEVVVVAVHWKAKGEPEVVKETMAVWWQWRGGTGRRSWRTQRGRLMEGRVVVATLEAVQEWGGQGGGGDASDGVMAIEDKCTNHMVVVFVVGPCCRPAAQHALYGSTETDADPRLSIADNGVAFDLLLPSSPLSSSLRSSPLEWNAEQLKR